MLKNIDPLLHADILHALRAMGHGDEVAICDANFPAETVARHTAIGRALRIGGADSAQVVRAVLSVMPLDTFVDAPALRMEVVGHPDMLPPVQREVQAEIDHAEGRAVPLQGIDRFAFYARAQQAYAVIVTGELRGYGCFIFKKGVLLSDAG
jgi:L-fucose mutarotase